MMSATMWHSSDRNNQTDYTYASSLSYRSRATPERATPSPVLARRGLHSGYTLLQQSAWNRYNLHQNEQSTSASQSLYDRTMKYISRKSTSTSIDTDSSHRRLDLDQYSSDGEGMNDISLSTKTSNHRSITRIEHTSSYLYTIYHFICTVFSYVLWPLQKMVEASYWLSSSLIALDIEALGSWRNIISRVLQLLCLLLIGWCCLNLLPLQTSMLSKSEDVAADNIITSTQDNNQEASWFSWIGLPVPFFCCKSCDSNCPCPTVPPMPPMPSERLNMNELLSQLKGDALFQKMVVDLVSDRERPESVTYESLEDIRKEMNAMVIKLDEKMSNIQDTKQQGSADLMFEMASQMKLLQSELSDLSAKLNKVSSDASNVGVTEEKVAMMAKVALDVGLMKSQLSALEGRMDEQSAKISETVLLYKNSSTHHAIVEEYLSTFVTMLFDEKKFDTQHPAMQHFSQWIHTHFVLREELEKRLANISNTVYHQTAQPNLHQNEQTVAMIMQTVSEHLKTHFEQQNPITTSNSMNINMSQQQIMKIVRDTLDIYDADKTGLVDFALESAGGSIVSTRCTETFQTKTAVVSIFGIPLWYHSNSPRTIIQPGVHPGQCWAFKGSVGYVIVRLGTFVCVDGVTIEHISPKLSPTGNIDSAPNEFAVLGLEMEKDIEGTVLVQGKYDREGRPLQYFKADPVSSKKFQFIELRVESNHGNPEYTCLYRFRVHGSLKS